MRWIAAGAVVVLVLGLGGMSVAGGDSVQNGEPQMRREQVRQVHWKTYGVPQGKTIRIISAVGYCVGLDKPRIEKVRVREERRWAFLTAFLVGPVPNRGEACADVAIGVRKIVHLRHRLDHRALYDASFLLRSGAGQSNR